MTGLRTPPARLLPRSGVEPRRGPTLRKKQDSSPGFRFLLPGLVVFGVFFAVPNVLNFVFAFTNWTSYRDDISFVGFDNFAYLFGSGELWDALRITLTYAIAGALGQNVIGLALAVALERDTRINRVARSIYFLPLLISPLAVGFIFQGLLQQDGPVNKLLSALSGQHVQFLWLGDTTWSLWVVIGIQIWKWTGLTVLVYIAGLKSVPHDFIEASILDGAGFFRRLRSVTIPLLGPAITFNAAVAVISSMNAFDIVLATTQGGPASSTRLLNIFLFQQYGQGFFGEATAMSLVLFATVTLLGVPLVIWLRRREVQL